jgi:PKD repeat protein
VSRIGFGILAAIVAALVVDLKVGSPLMNGVTIGLAVYLITYYLFKWLFATKVDKPTKLLTMGIGAYFLTFIMCWVLLVTPSLALPTAMFTATPLNPVVNDPVTFDASASIDPDGTIVKYVWNFGDEITNDETIPTVTHSYASTGNYTVTLTVVDDHGISSSNTTSLTVVSPS